MYYFPCDIWFVKPYDELIYKTILLMIIVVVGAIGNLLLLNIIVRNRALHTPTNLLLANMISADMLTLIFCPLMFICRDFFQNYTLGPIGCKLDVCLQGIFAKLFCSNIHPYR